MKKTGIVVIGFLLLGALFMTCSDASATDLFYKLSEESDATWDGTDGNTADYTYTYGDESSVTYRLPWAFSIYYQPYTEITVDTNGNIWFGPTDSAHSFSLATTGRGPVIAAWNNDLSSYYYGGAFIQHKTNPERVVVEWKTETYTEEGYSRPNSFEVVLYQDGTIRFDYKSFNTTTGKDFGSGVSKGDGSTSINLSTIYDNVFALCGQGQGRSFTFVKAPDLVAVGSPFLGSGGQPPATVYSGQQIVTGGGVWNQGPVPAAGSFIKFYLSTDSTITTSDTFLGETYVPSLPANSGTSQIVTFTVPAVSKGSYYVGAIVDPDNTVAESDETNNSFAYLPIIIDERPDLVVTDFTSPPSAFAYKGFPVQVTVKNQGSGSAGGFYVEIYASTDSTITTDDSYQTYAYVPSLAAGASATLNLTVSTLPAQIRPYVGVIVDPWDYVLEYDKTNNTIANAISFTIDSAPPLTTASLAGGTYDPPQTITLSCSDGAGSGCDKIYYTTDGTTPTMSSAVYTTPLTIVASATLKFFAADNGLNVETMKSQTYDITTYTITATAGVGGTISPSGSLTANYGGSQAFTITPNAGYHVTDVKVDGISQGALNSYTFTNFTAGHTIEATFAVRIDGTNPAYFPNFQAAYNAAMNGTTIQSQNVETVESLNLNRNIQVTLKGGYDASFTNVTGTTTLRGPLTISNGQLTVEKLTIKVQ